MIKWVVVCAVCLAVRAGAAGTPALEESLSQGTPGRASMSPDGKYVAYTSDEADWTADAFATQIRVGRTGSGRSYKLTNLPTSRVSPKWPPDGSWIAVATAGGAARVVAGSFDEDAGPIAWGEEGR